jgi:NOL1/NOP2/fmu family ribosome biogenesis protein
MFRKEEVAVSEWSQANVEMCAARQKEILRNAVKLLKNGGYIIYATCTFSIEENEMVVDDFLQNNPEFELVRVTERVEKNTSDGIFYDGCQCSDIHYARRFYPHKGEGEGQFMAVLHNTLPEENIPPAPKKKNDKIPAIVYDFLGDVLSDYDEENVMLYNGNPVYFTPDFPVKDGSAFSCGITIGEVRKNYIQPHHQFFMGLGDSFKRQINLSVDSPELKKYLHGEEINVECSNGWAVVMVEGCTLGGAKVVNGIAKNHYPKGLRLK